MSAIFGVWTAGATVCPIVPPSFQPADEYIRHVAAIVGQAAPRLTISSAEFVPLIGAALNLSGQPGLPWVLREGGEELSPTSPCWPGGPTGDPGKASRRGFRSTTTWD